jgi:hypothetical protein
MLETTLRGYILCGIIPRGVAKLPYPRSCHILQTTNPLNDQILQDVTLQNISAEYLVPVRAYSAEWLFYRISPRGVVKYTGVKYTGVSYTAE